MVFDSFRRLLSDQGTTLSLEICFACEPVNGSHVESQYLLHHSDVSMKYGLRTTDYGPRTGSPNCGLGIYINIYKDNLQQDTPTTANVKGKEKPNYCAKITAGIKKEVRWVRSVYASTLGWTITPAGSEFHSGTVLA